MQKVLILTYYWPPSGGPGVQRWLKFAGYLPEFGYQPYVVTVDPAQATYPVADDSLVEQVHKKVKVFLTPTLEPYSIYRKISGRKQVPYSGFSNESSSGIFTKFSRFVRGNLFVPDARKGWNAYALKEARRLIIEHEINIVITTSPPHSTQLVGLQLKKEFPSIKWIADLRDPWTDIFYYKKMLHLPLVRDYDLRLEKKVLTQADWVVSVSSFIKDLFICKVPNQNKDKFQVITNGYDEPDFTQVVGFPPNDIFTISYVGTLSEAYDIWGMIRAIDSLEDILPKPVHLHFTGSLSDVWREALYALSPQIWSTEGHVSHRVALERMRKSHILLLIIPKIEQNKGIVTGKIFEYIASEKPILGIGPVDGDAASILKTTRSGKMFDYHDITGMIGFIKSVLSDSKHFPDKEAIKSYSRKKLTEKLVGLF